MRNAVLVIPALAIAACAAAPAGPPTPPVRTCDAAGTDRFTGQPGTSEAGAAVLAATGATVLRWAPPGTMMTMDFSSERVTIHLGPDGRITQIACG